MLQMAHPLLFDNVWLQQGKFESAEAYYQQVLAGTGRAAVQSGTSGKQVCTCTRPPDNSA